jgi:gliding motility-associated-like protein
VWTVWDNDAQTFIEEDVRSRLGATSIITFRDQIAGTYTFYGVDYEGCDVIATVTITQPDSLTIDPFPVKTVCLDSNGRIEFKVKEDIKVGGGTPLTPSDPTRPQLIPYNITATASDGRVFPFNNTGSNRRDSAITNLPSGVYTVKITDAKGCEKETTVEIEDTPYPYLHKDTIVISRCDKDIGSIVLSPKDAPGPYKYIWTPNTNSLGELLAENRIGFLKPGDYTLLFLDGNGCKIDTTFTVGSFPAPTMTNKVRPETCERIDGGIELTYISQTSNDSLMFVWTLLPDTNKLPDTTYYLANLKAGTYTITLTDQYCSISDTIVVPHIDGPVANFTANTYTVPVNVILTLTDNTRGTPAIWNWDMGDENTMTGRVVRYSYEATGDYIVFMEVRDTNDCVDTISKLIHVYDQLHVYIPNTFTPDGNGLNETWKPILLEYIKEGYRLTVYDRWGQRVFSTNNPDEAWDGTIGGKPAENNTTYSYRLVVRDFTGQEFEYVGHISILR